MYCRGERLSKACMCHHHRQATNAQPTKVRVFPSPTGFCGINPHSPLPSPPSRLTIDTHGRAFVHTEKQSKQDRIMRIRIPFSCLLLDDKLVWDVFFRHKKSLVTSIRLGVNMERPILFLHLLPLYYFRCSLVSSHIVWKLLKKYHFFSILSKAHIS